MAARKWTVEQRKQQSLKIREWKPWLNSTGARTIDGKARASRNAFKGGVMESIKQLKNLMRKQGEFINNLLN